jgi:glucose/arabinose dehydrogenase
MGRLTLGAFILLVVAIFAVACTRADDDDGGDESNPYDITSEVVATPGQVSALAFAPDGRLFFSEHWTGNIRVIGADGQLLAEPFAHVESGGVFQLGLSGLALDPDFVTNHYVYAFFLQLTNPGPPPVGRPILVRFTEVDNKGTDQTVILGDLPETDPDHQVGVNGSIHFGPDGFLYVTLGDYDLSLLPGGKEFRFGPNGKEFAQDLASPIGKILRINKQDGSAPPDNPFFGQEGVDERIFAYGFRAPFDFTFHPQAGKLYGSDSSGVTCEELNIVAAGGQYGWPNGTFPHENCAAREQVPAIYYFTFEGRPPDSFGSSVDVTGMAFVSGQVYTTLGDSLLACESRTGFLRSLTMSGPEFDQVAAAGDPVVKDCRYAVAVSPAGIVYYSNLAEIRRLEPPKPTETPAAS